MSELLPIAFAWVVVSLTLKWKTKTMKSFANFYHVPSQWRNKKQASREYWPLKWRPQNTAEAAASEWPHPTSTRTYCSSPNTCRVAATRQRSVMVHLNILDLQDSVLWFNLYFPSSLKKYKQSWQTGAQSPFTRLTYYIHLILYLASHKVSWLITLNSICTPIRIKKSYLAHGECAHPFSYTTLWVHPVSQLEAWRLQQ